MWRDSRESALMCLAAQCEWLARRATMQGAIVEILTVGIRRALSGRMRWVWVVLILPGAVLSQEPGSEPAGSAFSEPAAPEININARYTVEDVQVTGIDPARMSRRLAQEIQRLVGEKFSQQTLDQLVQRLRRELRARTVSQKLLRGEKPEHVKVILEVAPHDFPGSDVSLSKFLYHARQGWSGKAIGNFNIAHDTGLLLGVASDGDDLLERYAGVVAGFESRKVGTDRVRLRFLFESYHQQWNRATLAALPLTIAGGPEDIYRTRHSFEPMLTAALSPSLSVSAGGDFQFIQMQYPEARYEAANAAAGSLRFLRRFDDGHGHSHIVDAAYELRAATGVLDSDFVYTRHQARFGYTLRGAQQAVVVDLVAGRLGGDAPLYDRFLLGNSTTLRGWNKFDVAPRGGNRLVHNTVEYRRSVARRGEDDATLGVFYDAGAVWEAGQEAETRHSVGVAARFGNLITPGLYIALAFPIKTGRMEPIFMAGTRF
jgi:hypothetical protein